MQTKFDEATEMKTRLILFIIILFTVFFTEDTVMYGTNANILCVKIPQVCFCCFSLFLPMYALAKRKKFEPIHILALLSIFLCTGATLAIRNDFRNGYVFRIAVTLFAFFAVEFIDIKTFAHVFNRVIFALAVISLACFVLEVFDHDFFSFAPRLTNIGSVKFRNLFLYVQYDGPNPPRNYGIFREPGVYQVFLIIALIFELYFYEKINFIRICVFSIAVFTTLSTTGIIAYGFWLLLFLSKLDMLSNKTKSLLIIAGSILILLACILMSAKLDLFINKVFGKMTTKNESYWAREASVFVNLKLWLRYPVFGTGLSNVLPYYEEETLKMYGIAMTANTNTLLIPFAAHGTLYGLLWLIAWFKGTCGLGKSTLEKALVGAVLLCLCMGESLIFSPFGNLLMMYGLLSKRKGKHRDRGYV